MISLYVSLDLLMRFDLILNWLTKQSNNGKQRIIDFGGIFWSAAEFVAIFISRIKEVKYKIFILNILFI
jgi:hypothetical protein